MKSGTSDLWQSRLSGSAKAKLQTLRSPGRAEMRKLNLISLAVKAGWKCGSGTSHVWKNWQSRNSERISCHIIGNQARADSGDAGAELHIIGSQSRAEVCKRNFRCLAVKTERKCESGTSDL